MAKETAEMIEEVQEKLSKLPTVPDELICKNCGIILVKVPNSLCGSCEAKRDTLLRSIPLRYREAKCRCSPSVFNETNILFFGDFGTGKTETSFAYIAGLIKRGKIKSFKRDTAYGILSRIKGGFGSGRARDEIALCQNTPLLVIDEFEKVQGSNFDSIQLYDIIRERDEWCKKTILICNAKDVGELEGIIPDPILDRFKHSLIEFSGQSKR